MEYFDTHMHLNEERFDEDRTDVVKKIKNAGVTTAIEVGCDVISSKEAIELSKKYDFIYAICGIHPENLPNSEKELMEEIEKLKKLITENEKVVAIGEIGLDYNFKNDNKEFQIKAFTEQIKLANELKLPISIHTRDAIDDTISIIIKTKIENSGVLHCCPFNAELVKHGLEAGLYIAFGGTCTFKNSKNAKNIVDMVPFDKILTETDSPFLAPEPIRGTRNDSSNLKYIVQKLAEYKNITQEEMAKIVYENAKKLFLNKENKNA